MQDVMQAPAMFARSHRTCPIPTTPKLNTFSNLRER